MNRLPAVLTSAFLAAVPLGKAAIAGSAGCNTPMPESGTHTFEYDGLERRYGLHAPPGHDHDTPAPLVLMFHGWGGDESAFLGHASVLDAANDRGYLLVAPVGLGEGPPDNNYSSWSFRGSNTGLDGSGGAVCDDTITDDYSYPSCADSKANTCSWTHCQGASPTDRDFVLALLDHLERTLCLDSERIYALGGSNGGMFAWDLVQDPASAPAFRAMASVIGLPHRGYLQGPSEDEATPVLLVTGLRDHRVPPGAWEDDGFTTTSNGTDRYYYTGATAIIQSWSEGFACDTSVEAAGFDAGVENVDCRSYCSSKQGWPAVLDCRADMGHVYQLDWTWPLALDFFDAHAP